VSRGWFGAGFRRRPGRLRPSRRLLLEALEDRTCPVLTLTPNGIAAGYHLSLFAVDFPHNGSNAGPLGIAFPDSGGVLVSDGPGDVRAFPDDSDGQSAAWYPGLEYGDNQANILTKLDGHVYMTQYLAGAVVQLNDDGTLEQYVAREIPLATGIVGDPFTGHLFVATFSGAIYDVDPVAQTSDVFASGSAGDLKLSPDGSVLYAVHVDGHVVGFDTSTGNIVFDSGMIPGNPTGVGLGTGPFTGQMYVDTYDGQVVQVDMTTLEQAVIASGGVVGDYISVDPNDGSLLLTQIDRVVRLRFPASAPPELFDPFTVSQNTTDVNFEVVPRQRGTLAPTTYTVGGEPVFSQVGNLLTPDTLLLAGRAAGTSGAVSLDHDFRENPGAGNALVIQFDVRPVLTGRPEYNTTQSSWIAVDFGTTAAMRNRFPQSNDGIGLLFRGDGRTQAFDAGANLGAGMYADSADGVFHHIRIEITDPTDGNPFDGDGSPALVRAFADDSTTPFFEYQRAAGFSSNYISLIGEGEGSGGDGVVRHALTNLGIDLSSVGNAPIPPGPGPRPPAGGAGSRTTSDAQIAFLLGEGSAGQMRWRRGFELG
jgi:hypothetical protein